MKVWVAEMAIGDSSSEHDSEILGVFSTEEAAQKVISEHGPRTGSATEFEVDSLSPWLAPSAG